MSQHLVQSPAWASRCVARPVLDSHFIHESRFELRQEVRDFDVIGGALRDQYLSEDAEMQQHRLCDSVWGSGVEKCWSLPSKPYSRSA